VGPQLRFYLAARGGQTAIIRTSDALVVGGLVMGADDLLRTRTRGDRAASLADQPGYRTATEALASFAAQFAVDGVGRR
jgi:hypothetical protein